MINKNNINNHVLLSNRESRLSNLKKPIKRNVSKSDYYRIRNSANKKIYYLLKTKQIIKPSCDLCESIENIEAHHNNYSEPFNITWLCSKCHSNIHNKNVQ